VEGFYGYIWDVHTNFPQYPIWITEYAETSTNDSGKQKALMQIPCVIFTFYIPVVLDFMNQTITYMDTLDWIERYSWFGFFVSR
jgi:hypothetical protein